jgi:hypothetical protein
MIKINKIHELVIIVQAKAIANMTITFMKAKSLSNQCAMALFTMPLNTCKTNNAYEYLFL